MKSIPLMSIRGIIVGLALAGCGGADREITVPPTGLVLVPVADLGPDLHGGQVEEGGLALGPGGTVAVVHAVARQVFVLAPGSGEVTVLGREGAGPGEFGGPRVVAVTDDGVVAVFDRALRRLSFWSPDGSVVEERHFPRDAWAMSGERNSVLVKVGRGAPPEDGSFTILRVEPGVERDEVALQQGTPTPAGGPIPPGGPLPQVCSACPFFGLPSGRWVFQPAGFTDQVVAVDPEARVEVVWSRGRVPGPVSREEWLEERLRLHEWARALAADRTPMAGAAFPPFDSTLSGDPPLRRGLSSRGAIGVDGRGRLWTLPSLPLDVPSLVEVHDGDGTFLGGFTLDRRPLQMAVRGEWLALVFEDEVGLATVRVFRIEEG